MTTAAAARVADTIEPSTPGRRPRRSRFGAVPSKATGAIVLVVIGALFAIPKTAILPLVLLVFGLGEQSKWAIIAIGVFFPVLISTAAGVAAIGWWRAGRRA